jgi:hypothetical protein
MQPDSANAGYAQPSNSKFALYEGLPRPYRWDVFAITDSWRTRKVFVNARSAAEAAKLVLEQNGGKGVIGTSVACCNGRVGETSPVRAVGCDLEEPGGARYWIPTDEYAPDWWEEVDSYGNKLPGVWEFYEEEGIAKCVRASRQPIPFWSKRGERLERKRGTACEELAKKLRPWDFLITFDAGKLTASDTSEEELCALVDEVGKKHNCERVGPNVWRMNHDKKLWPLPQLVLNELCREKWFAQHVGQAVCCYERKRYQASGRVAERATFDMLEYVLRNRPELLLEEQEQGEQEACHE